MSRPGTSPTHVATSDGRSLVVGPDGFPTIAAAVAEAREGDTVRVTPGRYDESVSVTIPIAIVGEGRRGSVVVAHRWQPVFVVQDVDVRLTGLTVSGGARRFWPDQGAMEGPSEEDDPGAAIRLTNCRAVIEDVELREHAGLIVLGGDVAVRKCKVGNGFEGAVFFGLGATGSVEDSEVVGVESNYGIKASGRRTSVAIRRNYIHSGSAIGIIVAADASATIEGNRIHKNGDGIFVYGRGARAVIRHNSIRENDRFGIDVKEGALRYARVRGRLIQRFRNRRSRPVTVAIEDNEISGNDISVAILEPARVTLQRNRIDKPIDRKAWR